VGAASQELKARTPAPGTPHSIYEVRFSQYRVAVAGHIDIMDLRNARYLKRTVLEDLVRTRDVNKVHIKRVLSPVEVEQRRATMSKAQLKKTSSSVAALSQPVSTWMWQLVDKKRTEKDVGGNEEGAAAFGAEVGVGEDWGHLNRRRRRAREEKVERDVKWMRKVQGVRTESGLKDESSAS